MSKKLGLIRHAILLGWVDPVRSVVMTYFQQVPMNLKITYRWAILLKRRFRVTLTKVGDGEVLGDRRCLFLCPHRSFADLFLHKFLTDGHGATLSRAGMGVVFPLTWLATRIDHSTWFFRRGKRQGIKAFFSWLDHEFDRCPLNGLIVYAEGTRNLSEAPLRLKTGMINYAYSRKLPIQILSTQRTERVLNEKQWDYAYDVEVLYRIEEPIDPQDFSSRKAFQDEITRVFEQAYTEVTLAR